mgnify:CR=1 FL=1
MVKSVRNALRATSLMALINVLLRLPWTARKILTNARPADSPPKKNTAALNARKDTRKAGITVKSVLARSTSIVPHARVQHAQHARRASLQVKIVRNALRATRRMALVSAFTNPRVVSASASIVSIASGENAKHARMASILVKNVELVFPTLLARIVTNALITGVATNVKSVQGILLARSAIVALTDTRVRNVILARKDTRRTAGISVKRILASRHPSPRIVTKSRGRNVTLQLEIGHAPRSVKRGTVVTPAIGAPKITTTKMMARA